MTVVLYRVIKVGAQYLDAPHWGILSSKQRHAYRFPTQEMARKFAESWRADPAYGAMGVRVVRIVARAA